MDTENAPFLFHCVKQKWRKFLVFYAFGGALLLVNAWFGTYFYVVVQALLWGQTSLLRGPLVVLFALALGNLVALRFARRFALTQQELLTLYAMLCIGTCAAGYGFVQILINHIAAPFYYATGGNGFADRLQPNIPLWAAPHDPEVYNGFFRGNTTLYTPVHLLGWLTPVLAWSLFIGAIFWTSLCMTTLFRRQWVEEERLTFPLVLLPLQLTNTAQGGMFWLNRWMWIGFIVAGALESINFLNFLYPSIPAIPLKPSMGQNEIGAMLTSPPWNAAGRLTLAFYPFGIGIGYLLALDVSFSCWFLYLMSKAAVVLCAALGLSDGATGSPSARMPFIREQGAGAFIGLAGFSIWMARRALSAAWREAERPTGSDRDELMSFRMAYFGGAAGLLIQAAFLVALGFSATMAGLYVILYACFSLTLARIVSEVGAGWAWAPMWSATNMTGETLGLSQISAKQMTALLANTQWMSDMRDNPFPQMAQAMKISGQAAFPARALLGPLIFAIIVGTIAAFWAHLDIYYVFGAATAKVRPALMNGATGPARQAATLIVTPTLQDWPGIGAAIFGGFMVIALAAARQAFNWWPLHPLGYAVAMTNSMEYMWCPFLIAWAAKTVTLRYGGIRAYRAALPFFLGLILGDYVVPTLWGIFGAMSKTQQYMSFPH